MNKFIKMILLLAVICAINVYCCQTKPDQSSDGKGCQDPHIYALGQYVLQSPRVQQRFSRESCEIDNVVFVTKAPISPGTVDFDAKKLAGVWLYKDTNQPELTFSGVDETLRVLKDHNTFNILVDKKFSVKKYILRNSTNGEISVDYLSDDDLLEKISTEMYWNHIDVLHCDNFLHFLSKEFANQLFSVTIMDMYQSSDELRFIVRSGGIGGFVKKNDEYGLQWDT